jgi:hypothetical protein
LDNARVSRPASRQSSAASLAVLAAFVGLGLLGVLHHEPWRDELEIWLIARDSESLPALLRNMGTEGHPSLWYLVNFGLTRATRDPLAMQLVNLALGAAAALVFFRAAPFGLATRLLFVFGYYALFEFSVIARSYALELLLLFAYCARAARRERAQSAGALDLPGAVLLALLAHANLFGTIAALALVGAELLELPARRPRWAALGLAGGAAGLAFAHVLAQSLAIGPDHGAGYRATWDLPWALGGLAAPALGALPLLDLASPSPWNSNLLHELPAPWHPLLGAFLGAGLLAAGAAALPPRWRRAFLLGVAPMLGITWFVWYGSTRHHGQPFLWFLACAWLAGGLPRGAERALTALLALQLLAGAALLRADLARPFSSARAAAAWLERPENAGALLAGARDFAVEPIAAFTTRPFYYPDQRRTGTFMDWSAARVEVGWGRVAAEAAALAARERRRVLLVLNEPPRRGRAAARFDGAIVPDENYWVVVMEPPAPPPASPP